MNEQITAANQAVRSYVLYGPPILPPTAADVFDKVYRHFQRLFISPPAHTHTHRHTGSHTQAQAHAHAPY